jgi:hypothetical protein
LLKIDGSDDVELEPVTYSNTLTPLLESISPRYGSVLGSTLVTLTGSNFAGAAEQTTVLFDDRECVVQSISTTEITCLTSDKPYVPDTPYCEIIIESMGNVATQGLVYRYVSLWSDTETWGGDAPPLEGESISIPAGQHLLVDIDESPIINLIVVEGSLIFEPSSDKTQVRTFDAYYIMVFGGYVEVGTEAFPYDSKLIITMHGNKETPYLPIYGNKVLGVRFGILDMHGVTRNITWTRLAETALAGDSSITLMEETDWAVGE